MKKYLSIFLLLFLVIGVSAQDTNNLLDTFLDNFEKATDEIKYQVLLDAVDMGMAGFGPLYIKAVNYVIDNQASIRKNSTLNQIGQFAVNQIAKTAYKPATDSVWKYFTIDATNESRLIALDAMKIIAIDNERVIKGLCDWLEAQTSSFRAGATPDLQVIRSTVETLGVWKNNVAFKPLFNAMRIKYSEEITRAAEKAILQLEGDPKDLYLSVIKDRPMDEKLDALKTLLRSADFKDTEKAEVALAALEVALHTNLSDSDEKQTARLIRYTATEELSRQKWTAAANLIIEHFNQSIDEFDKGVSAKIFLISAITALGNMQNNNAAKRLTLYLDLLNSYTEHSQPYDEQIVLSVIQSLESLADSISSSTLLYTRYLNYNDTIKKAALKALQSLK
ncbi:MAG: hypothetical protein JXR70_05730 [Spirochaetales bacterium]|nr:hypothetical protein [Spirochaetales bacterium]